MKNRRLIFIPQLPTKLRYTEWWIEDFKKNLKDQFSDFIVIGEKYLNSYINKQIQVDNQESFNNLNKSIEFELFQIQEFMNFELQSTDILLLADISFPGLFCNILYHKRPQYCFAICHGTSKNAFDIFEKDKDSKWKIESGHAELFNRIFVGSAYHKTKLKWQNVKVIGMPDPPMQYTSNIKNKTIDIISVARKTEQKVNLKIEKQVEEKFGKIYRKEYNTWNEYFDALSKSKILLITANEETYGYQIIDCLKYGNGCVPLAPQRLSYPELLSEDYLYRNFDIQGLFNKIELILNNQFNSYDNLQFKPSNFYHLLYSHMERAILYNETKPKYIINEIKKIAEKEKIYFLASSMHQVNSLIKIYNLNKSNCVYVNDDCKIHGVKNKTMVLLNNYYINPKNFDILDVSKSLNFSYITLQI